MPILGVDFEGLIFGILFYVQSNNGFHEFLHSGVFIDPETLDWNEGHEEISFLEINANDHSISEYVNILKKRLRDGD